VLRSVHPRKVRTPQGRPLVKVLRTAAPRRERAIFGKCHREETASGPGFAWVRARVKRWGKSPPPRSRESGARQTPAGARPSKGASGPLDAPG